MRKIMVKLFLVMSLALPVYVSAQEVDTPTPDIATLESTQTPDIITATPSPTAEATADPSPVPPVDPAPPIDQTKVFESVYSVALALVVGAVAIALTGIVGLLLLLAPALRAIIMSGIKTGIDEAGKIAEKTETKIDDMAVEELRKLYLEIEKRLSEAEVKVDVNAADIATTNRAVSQVISNS